MIIFSKTIVRSVLSLILAASCFQTGYCATESLVAADAGTGAVDAQAPDIAIMNLEQLEAFMIAAETSGRAFTVDETTAITSRLEAFRTRQWYLPSLTMLTDEMKNAFPLTDLQIAVGDRVIKISDYLFPSVTAEQRSVAVGAVVEQWFNNSSAPGVFGLDTFLFVLNREPSDSDRAALFVQQQPHVDVRRLRSDLYELASVAQGDVKISRSHRCRDYVRTVEAADTDLYVHCVMNVPEDVYWDDTPEADERRRIFREEFRPTLAANIKKILTSFKNMPEATRNTWTTTLETLETLDQLARAQEARIALSQEKMAVLTTRFAKTEANPIPWAAHQQARLAEAKTNLEVLTTQAVVSTLAAAGRTRTQALVHSACQYGQTMVDAFKHNPVPLAAVTASVLSGRDLALARALVEIILKGRSYLTTLEEPHIRRYTYPELERSAADLLVRSGSRRPLPLIKLDADCQRPLGGAEPFDVLGDTIIVHEGVVLALNEAAATPQQLSNALSFAFARAVAAYSTDSSRVAAITEFVVWALMHVLVDTVVKQVWPLNTSSNAIMGIFFEFQRQAVFASLALLFKEALVPQLTSVIAMMDDLDGQRMAGGVGADDYYSLVAPEALTIYARPTTEAVRKLLPASLRPLLEPEPTREARRAYLAEDGEPVAVARRTLGNNPCKRLMFELYNGLRDVWGRVDRAVHNLRTA